MDVRFNQLVTVSPEPFAGTRPAAMPPSAVAMKKGVRSEEIANVAPAAWRARSRFEARRKAKPEPRNTIPSAATASGIQRVVKIAEKAGPNAVHETTRTKMSQT